MDGILLVNKEKDYTSRDVVNIVSSVLKTKKVGHFGTLDPLATGLLVIGVGKYTKFGNILENHTKKYEVEVLIGKKTDTYDVTGNVLEEKQVIVDENKLKEVLFSFIGKYEQEVPIYSAVKVNGKKLYEYARNNKKVVLPKKEVEILDVSDFKLKNNIFSFTCLVSKGTYIRSLVNDISNKINIPMCMSNLKRIECCNYSLKDSFSISDIKDNKFKFSDIDLNYKKVLITKDIENKILNGNKIENIYNTKRVIFVKDNKNIVLYEEKNNVMYPIFFF